MNDYDIDLQDEDVDKRIKKVKKRLSNLNKVDFPALLKKFIKKIIFGLLKLWGVLLLIGICLILYYTGSYKDIYIKYSIGIAEYQVDSFEETIIVKNKQIKEKNSFIKCQKNQLKRRGEGKIIELNFCKK